MTLIIGIKCSDGVVVGADGAATLGQAGMPTVMQPVRKLTILDQMIVGISGPVGLGQLFRDRIKSVWDAQLQPQTHSLADVMRLTSRALAQDIQPAMNAASQAEGLLGQVAHLSVMSSSLIALPVQGAPELIQYDHLGLAEAATDDLPYVAIGSGQQLADPFLAFLRRIYWPDELPNVAGAVFADPVIACSSAF